MKIFKNTIHIRNVNNTLIVFRDIIADINSNIQLVEIETKLFIKGKNLNIVLNILFFSICIYIYTYIYIYYIYIYIYIYMNNKNTKFIKITNIFFSSDALSMYNKITNDNSAT